MQPIYLAFPCILLSLCFLAEAVKVGDLLFLDPLFNNLGKPEEVQVIIREVDVGKEITFSSNLQYTIWMNSGTRYSKRTEH